MFSPMKVSVVLDSCLAWSSIPHGPAHTTGQPVGFLKTWSDSSYLGQTDSSYMGQEVKISDPVWKIVSLADNNNIAPPLAFICGAWRPKADYLGDVRGRSPPTDIARGLGGGSPPAYSA